MSCERCGFPLAGAEPGNESAPTADTPHPASDSDAESAPPILLRRPQRRPRRSDPQIVSLWLMFAAFAAMALIWLAVKVNVDRQQQPVEGAREGQQQRADQMRALLAKDSTNVQAHIGLADVLYDTGNWSEAIVHYRAAIRRDSSLATSIVDEGVCYYNLGDGDEAERHFHLALARDPHQPVALFNLGIVSEHRKELEQALRYYHSAMESNPPVEMQQPLIDAVKRIQQQTGKTAPPLSQ